MTTHVELIESTDPRLNRHVVHDPRSRDHAVAAAGQPKAVRWERKGPILNQGEVGACTAFTGVGLMMTEPYWSHGSPSAPVAGLPALQGQRGRTPYTDADGLQLYREETRLDDREIPGHWEPDDTGSAGLYMAKALKRRGLISGYSHAFSTNAALAALQQGPLAVGSVWLDSMFEPGPGGELTVDPRSGSAGGHEYVVDEYDPTGAGWVWLTNHWDTTWGEHGRARMRLAAFHWLLAQQGDVVQPAVP